MIDFNKKKYTDILENLMVRVPDTLDKREGSIIHTALGPAGWYLEGVYHDLRFFFDNAYADTAAGVYLDKIAMLLDVERKAATYPIKTGEFDQKVPIGSRFSILSSDGPYITYQATDYMGACDGIHRYKLQCEVAGEAGNAYIGSLIPIDYIPSLELSRLTATLIAGAEEETDKALRDRLLLKARMPSTSGNIYDYYNWAAECDGVGGVKVFPLANGPGTVGVIIADNNMSAASAELIQQVYEHIEDLRPIGADVSVISATEKEINVTAKAKIENGLNLGVIQETYRGLLVEYLKANAFGTNYVSIAKVGSMLLDTPGVEDFTDLLLNGLPLNVKLLDEELAVTGTVTLEVM